MGFSPRHFALQLSAIVVINRKRESHMTTRLSAAQDQRRTEVLKIAAYRNPSHRTRLLREMFSFEESGAGDIS